MLKFRLLTAEDFPQMLKWLFNNHVKEWWDDEDDTLEKIADHYETEEADVKRFILTESENGIEKSLGYFQYYFVPEDGSIGIDQFIGEADYLNRGIGTEAIKLFIQMIEGEHSPTSIILDPAPENKRAIRCYEKAGFTHYETKINEDGHPAYMMRWTAPS